MVEYRGSGLVNMTVDSRRVVFVGGRSLEVDGQVVATVDDSGDAIIARLKPTLGLPDSRSHARIVYKRFLLTIHREEWREVLWFDLGFDYVPSGKATKR
jgi:hypothetical protein